MKKLWLIFDFLKKNISALLIVVCALTMSMFMLITVYGKYRYKAYAKEVYSNSGLQNAIFFYYDVTDMTLGRNAAMEECEFFAASLHSKFPEVKNLSYTYDMANSSNLFNVKYLNDNLVERMPLPVIEGRWLNQRSESTEAVVGGEMFRNVKIGDVIKVSEEADAIVVGRMTDRPIALSLSSYSTYLSADCLFDVTDNIIFINSEGNNLCGANYPLGWFISFDNMYSLERRNECMAFLRDHGKVYTYNQIMENTNHEIYEWIKDALPFPVFTITVSTLLVLTLVIVIIQKNRSDHSKYYIIGCSKIELILISSSAMCFVILIPCGVNIFLAVFYPNFMRMHSAGLIDYIIDIKTVFPIIIYGATIVALIVYLTIVDYRKYSPVRLYDNRG